MSSSGYGLLRSAAGAVEGLTGVVWVEGPDTISFLDGLLSQNIDAMVPGSARPSLLLAPNGKLRATLWLLRGENRVGLVCDAGRTGTVVSDLTRFKIRVDAGIAAEERPVWDVWGPQARNILADMPGPRSWIESDRVVADLPFRHSDLPRLIVVGEPPVVPVVSPEAMNAVRIEVGEPAMGRDLTDSTIPQEGVDVTATVDFTKGCYLGQELVARLDSRGHINRRLTGFVFGGAELPPSGAEVVYEGKAVGTLSSVAFSEGLGAPVALGMIRTAVAAGSRVVVEGCVGAVTGLPLQA